MFKSALAKISKNVLVNSKGDEKINRKNVDCFINARMKRVAKNVVKIK